MRQEEEFRQLQRENQSLREQLQEVQEQVKENQARPRRTAKDTGAIGSSLEGDRRTQKEERASPFRQSQCGQVERKEKAKESAYEWPPVRQYSTPATTRPSASNPMP
jgi:hypothetical protein